MQVLVVVSCRSCVRVVCRVSSTSTNPHPRAPAPHSSPLYANQFYLRPPTLISDWASCLAGVTKRASTMVADVVLHPLVSTMWGTSPIHAACSLAVSPVPGSCQRSLKASPLPVPSAPAVCTVALAWCQFALRVRLLQTRRCMRMLARQEIPSHLQTLMPTASAGLFDFDDFRRQISRSGQRKRWG